MFQELSGWTLWFGLAAKAVFLAIFAFLVFVNWRRVADSQGRLLALVGAAAAAAIALVLPSGASAALVLLALAYTLGSRALAAIGALMEVYFIWRFYQDLEGTLLTKSIVLMAAGAILLLCYGLLIGDAARAEAIMKKARVAIALAGLALILALTNWDIAQKRKVIADGRVLLLELRPVDPRSLFQGDYMALALADATMPDSATIATLPYRGTVILSLDGDRCRPLRPAG